MTLDEAIGQYMAYVDAEKMGITSFTITTREAEQLAGWLKELKAYREAMIYLFTAESDGYQLHKWTSEYGYVITVHDVIKAFDRVKEVQND